MPEPTGEISTHSIEHGVPSVVIRFEPGFHPDLASRDKICEDIDKGWLLGKHFWNQEVAQRMANDQLMAIDGLNPAEDRLASIWAKLPGDPTHPISIFFGDFHGIPFSKASGLGDKIDAVNQLLANIADEKQGQYWENKAEAFIGIGALIGSLGISASAFKDWLFVKERRMFLKGLIAAPLAVTAARSTIKALTQSATTYGPNRPLASFFLDINKRMGNLGFNVDNIVNARVAFTTEKLLEYCQKNNIDSASELFGFTHTDYADLTENEPKRHSVMKNFTRSFLQTLDQALPTIGVTSQKDIGKVKKAVLEYLSSYKVATVNPVDLSENRKGKKITNPQEVLKKSISLGPITISKNVEELLKEFVPKS